MCLQFENSRSCCRFGSIPNPSSSFPMIHLCLVFSVSICVVNAFSQCVTGAVFRVSGFLCVHPFFFILVFPQLMKPLLFNNQRPKKTKNISKKLRLSEIFNEEKTKSYSKKLFTSAELTKENKIFEKHIQ